MTAQNQSLVAVAALGDLLACSEFTEAQGWGPDNLSVPLSMNGAEPASHFGCHAWTTTTGALVVSLGAPEGVTVSIIEDAEPVSHFTAVISGLGLQRIAQSA